jgi:WD40 repeat protein
VKSGLRVQLLMQRHGTPATRPLREIGGLAGAVSSISVCSDGPLAASGSFDGMVRIWDTRSGSLVTEFAGHRGPVSSVSLSRSGATVVSGSFDRTLRVWEVSPPRLRWTLRGHDAWVTDVVIDDRERCAISSSYDGRLRVWDLASGEPLDVLEGHEAPVTAVRLMNDGSSAISASLDGTVRLWDLTGMPGSTCLLRQASPISSVALLSDSTGVIAGSWDYSLVLLRGDRPSGCRRLAGHTSWPTGIAVHGPSGIAVTTSADRTIRAWDTVEAAPLGIIRSGEKSVGGLALSDEGLLFAGDDSGRISVWSLEQRIDAPDGHSDSVWTVAVSADGRLAVSGSADRTVRVWDVERGRELRTMTGHSSAVTSVALADQAHLVVSGSYDGIVRVSMIDDNALSAPLFGHTDRIWGVSVSTRGDLAVSAGADRTLKFWSVTGRSPLRTVAGRGAFTACALSSAPRGEAARGYRVAAGGRCGALLVLDLELPSAPATGLQATG